jgi:hypothetical protein
VRWTENGNQVSTNPNYTFVVTGNRNLVAQFQPQSFYIAANANPNNGGTVSGCGSYTFGQSCTLTATPASGYTFINWTKNGTQVSTNASYTFTVTEAATYVAQFQRQTFTVTLTANPAEGGTVTGDGTYNYGDEVTVTIVTNEDYAFQNWTENGEVVSEEKTFTFIATSDRNLTANLLYTVGLNELGNSIMVYPNPVSDNLSIEAKEAIGKVEIYNVMGTLVYSQKDCESKVEIETSQLPAGTYLIRLTTDNATVMRRFVKE